MGKALYRKYRSKSLSEIVGQEHITRALSRALEKEQVSHAYLFTGPRGVGKTSIARILAFEVNGLPYDEAATHLDIIEIDAASNRGIEDVRELRERVHVAPASAKYKVYIIDEIHMLTTPAFNALLKTLEEPPAHAIFILATTEMHKLPETIISRTQHFAFKPVAQNEVAAHLRSIADKEKVTIEDEALELIASHGSGSFRDSISLLDQVRNYADTITADDVRALLGAAPEKGLRSILQSVADQQPAELLAHLRGMYQRGIEAPTLSRQLIDVLQAQLLDASHTLKPQANLSLTDALLKIPSALQPRIALQTTLLKFTFDADPQNVSAAKAAPAVSPAEPQKPTVRHLSKESESKPETKPAAKQPPVAEAEAAAEPAKPLSGEPLDETEWTSVLTHIKKTYNTMYGVLRMAEPRIDGSELTLVFKFAFHQKRLNDPKNRQIIQKAIEEATGKKMKLNFVVGQTEEKALKAAKKLPDEQLGNISNIFGGAELLES